MPFDRQAVAALRARMLAGACPTSGLAGEAAALAEAARGAGDGAGELEALYLLLTLLAWQGAVVEAAVPLGRLEALAPGHTSLFAFKAELARLAGDRRETARLCAEGWLSAEMAPGEEGRGLLLGCWAWASADPEHFHWCVETGRDLDADDLLTDLDLLAFHGHVAGAALDLEDWDLALEEAGAAAKAFPPEAVPPLAEFLRQRTLALYCAGIGEFDRELAELLRNLVAAAERNGWIAWLPALDAALALTPEE